MFLTLYIGVRWFWSSGPGQLDIDVEIDGKPVTKGERFPTPLARKKPDSFTVELAQGRHRLRAASPSQGAQFEVEFDVADQARYAELCYDYYPKDHPSYPQDRPFEGFTSRSRARISGGGRGATLPAGVRGGTSTWGRPRCDGTPHGRS